MKCPLGLASATSPKHATNRLFESRWMAIVEVLDVVGDDCHSKPTMLSTDLVSTLQSFAEDWYRQFPVAFGQADTVDRFRGKYSSLVSSLLMLRGSDQHILHRFADAISEVTFGGATMVRGVIEWTNLCQRSCDYCPMRKENGSGRGSANVSRYQMTSGEIADNAKRILQDGLSVVFIQGGEIPKIDALCEAISEIQRESKRRAQPVEILVNVGTLDEERYARLRKAGAGSAIIKLEHADAETAEAATHYSYSERRQRIRDVLQLGYRVGTGTIQGIPRRNNSSSDSAQGEVHNAFLGVELGTHMISVSPFVAAPDTPYAHEPSGNVDVALNMIAVMRILDPAAIIPAVSAFEKLERGGQRRAFHAGANNITVNYNESHGQEYLIYGKQRKRVSFAHGTSVMRQAGRFHASASDVWRLHSSARAKLLHSEFFLLPCSANRSTRRTSAGLRCRGARDRTKRPLVYSK